MMYFGLYLLYAYIQGVLYARIASHPSPSAVVFGCMLFAPILTIGLIWFAIVEFTEFLVRVGNERKN